MRVTHNGSKALQELKLELS